MIGTSLQDAINEQVKNEFYSAYLYLSMASYFEHNNLPGLAKWMRVQHGEELTHAHKLFEFVISRGGRAVVPEIAKPPTDFESTLDVFGKAYEHEKKITGLIDKLYEQSVKENDYSAQVLLQWFITEQVEEEKNASSIVDMLTKIGPSYGGLMQLDHRLGKRGEK